MFRVLGGVVGFIFGLPMFFPFGMILGGFLGSTVGRFIDETIFGLSDKRGRKDPFEEFFKQYYNSDQRRSYSGYTNSHSNSYTGFENVSASNTDYVNLGCSQSDSNDLIKKSYRKMVSQYHPDKIASKGLNPEEVKRYEEKFKNIQNSYARIKKERGI